MPPCAAPLRQHLLATLLLAAAGCPSPSVEPEPQPQPAPAPVAAPEAEPPEAVELPAAPEPQPLPIAEAIQAEPSAPPAPTPTPAPIETVPEPPDLDRDCLRWGDCQGDDDDDERFYPPLEPRPKRGRPYDGLLPQALGSWPPSSQPWVDAARAEQASVPAFERHVAELIALRAPSDFVLRARAAADDERRHARACLQVARQLGARVRLGPVPQGRPPSTELEAVLTRVATEGCRDEALSVWALCDDLDQATVGADVLRQLIADEIEHARLAWDTLSWGLPHLAPAARGRVLAALLSRPAGVSPHAFDAVVRRPAAQLAA